MKKIFYSMMAVALCSCAQSEVDDMGNALQPENNGVTFTVVDNGFVNEDGTRVAYGEGTTANFVDGDVIGIYAINTSGSNMEADDPTFSTSTDNAQVPVEAAYIVNNAKLTLSGGVWKLTDSEGNTGVDFGNADLLFAYRPYDPNKTINSKGNDGRPSFTGSTGNWAINKGNNRFFVHPWDQNWETPTEADFAEADWMGAAANIATGQTNIAFNMIHMRGMIEVTTHKDVKLTEVKMGFSANANADYKFVPYFVNETDNDRAQNVYRILTTEYRKALTIYATIQDEEGNSKKYKKVLDVADYKKAGVRVCVNIPYTPPTVINVEGTTLEAALTAKFGEDYATDPALTSLRLTGTLQGADAASEDWATLRKLTNLKALDMSGLSNTSLPQNWLKGTDNTLNIPLRTALTSLVLPSGLTNIGGDALQVDNVTNIDIPTTVTEIGGGAFYLRSKLSVRIPEGSRLATVGNGAFNSIKAIYTYDNNSSMVVLPGTLTNIAGGNAFGVSSLRQVEFKEGTTTPTIDAGAFNGTNAYIFVPKKDGYAGKFPGKTVIVGPVLTTDNYSSPYTYSDGAKLPGLCDGNIETFWHTCWWGASEGHETYGQYIDITLPEGVTMNSLMVQYVTRSNNANAVPTAVDIYTSNDDGNTWTKLVTLPEKDKTMPTYQGEAYTTDKLTVTAPTKIRFAITESAQGSLCGVIPALDSGVTKASTSLAELTIGEEIWIDSAN